MILKNNIFRPTSTVYAKNFWVKLEYYNKKIKWEFVPKGLLNNEQWFDKIPGILDRWELINEKMISKLLIDQDIQLSSDSSIG